MKIAEKVCERFRVLYLLLLTSYNIDPRYYLILQIKKLIINFN